jgi:hypothetical protein
MFWPLRALQIKPVDIEAELIAARRRVVNTLIVLSAVLKRWLRTTWRDRGNLGLKCFIS